MSLSIYHKFNNKNYAFFEIIIKFIKYNVYKIL